MRALIEQSRLAGAPYTVVRVLSDQPDAAGLAVARNLGVAAQVVEGARTADRAAYDLGLAAAIQACSPSLIVLAGFMRILSAQFVSEFRGRILNIHPSLLPKYAGLHTHRRALEAMDREHGASVHFVTAELDGGPLVLQSRVPILPGDTEAGLAARVQATEHIIYPQVIGMMADGRLAWDDGRVRLDGKILEAPMESASVHARQ